MLLVMSRGRSNKFRAIVVSFVCLAGLCLTTGSPLFAQELPPVPAIQEFQVNWAEADPELGTYTFTITGTATNWEHLLNPAVEIIGYPFESAVFPDTNGAFSVQFTYAADVAFGRHIVAFITENVEQVSEDVFTST